MSENESAVSTPVLLRTGVDALDERVGGLEAAGSYLITGVPGPVKLVTALHFLAAGLEAGERVALVTAAAPDELLAASRSWGVELHDAYRDRRLTILGFREDFELRAARSVVPHEVLDELDLALGKNLERLVVDPGTLFLSGGARTLLSGSFLRWARRHPATVLTTFSVDGADGALPATAEWMVNATSGRLVVERRSGELYQITLVPAVPTGEEKVEPVSLQLAPGEGLRRPSHFPSRRGDDRGAVDPDRLLLVPLGEESSQDLAAWAQSAFRTRIAGNTMEAVEELQRDSGYGCVLVHGPRAQVRDAIQLCRALRPLTRSAILYASDDDLRSTDRLQLLEAGADDCLTGGLDFRELAVLIRSAALSDARDLTMLRGEAGLGSDWIPEVRGSADAEAFRDEVHRRAGDPMQNVFCVVQVPNGTDDPEDLGAAILGEIRDEDGDLMLADDSRHLVLLQGARVQQARPFVRRLEGRIGRALETDVLSHPAQADAIFALVGEAGEA